MRSFAHRRPVLAHFLLATAIALLVMVCFFGLLMIDPSIATAMNVMVADIYGGGGYTNMMSITGEAVKRPVLFLVFVFAAAPSIAALLIARTGAGGGLRLLLSRFRWVGPEGTARSAASLYLGLFAVFGLGFLVYDFVAGPGVESTFRFRSLGVGLLLGALVSIFIDEGGTLEELGWRGFSWPLLQDRLGTPLAAALLLGVIHWAWHLPRELPGLLAGAPASFYTGQILFLFTCVTLSIIAGYCVNLTGGSVWPAIFVHGGTNVWSKAFDGLTTSSFGVLGLRDLLQIVIAAAILIVAGRKLGRRRPRPTEASASLSPAAA